MFNYKELSPNLVATLAMGLPHTSRVKMKITGRKLTLEQTLLALILDDFNLYLWAQKKHRGTRPKSIYKELTTEKKPKDELLTFRSPEDYEKWRKRKQETWDNG